LVPEVVAGSPHEEITLRLLEHEAEVRTCPEVLFVAVITNARVLRGVLPAKGFGGIGGSIIGDDQLQVDVRLLE